MVERPEEHALVDEHRREARRVFRLGIGARLGQAYDDIVNEPTPASWLALLRLADERAQGSEESPPELRRAG